MKNFILAFLITASLSAQELKDKIIKGVETDTEFVMRDASYLYITYVRYKGQSILERYEFINKKERNAFAKKARKLKRKAIKRTAK